MLNYMHSRIQQWWYGSILVREHVCDMSSRVSPKCGVQASFQSRQAQKLFQMQKAGFLPIAASAEALFRFWILCTAEFSGHDTAWYSSFSSESSNMIASELSRWAAAGTKPSAPFWIFSCIVAIKFWGQLVFLLLLHCSSSCAFLFFFAARFERNPF